MKIYVVVEESRNPYSGQKGHMSFDNKSDALDRAIDVAKGYNGFGDKVKLNSIYEVDLDNKGVVEMTLVMFNGSFELKHKGSE